MGNTGAETAGPQRRRAWTRPIVAVVAPVGNPVHAIYGTILTAGLIAEEDPRHADISDIAWTVAITIIVFWLAHGYAHLIGSRLDGESRPSWRDAWVSLVEHWPIVRSAVPPLLALVVAAALHGTGDDAQQAALWTDAAMLAVFGHAAGHASGLHGPRLWAYSAGAAALGMMIIAAEVLIHH